MRTPTGPGIFPKSITFGEHNRKNAKIRTPAKCIYLDIYKL